MLIDPMYFYDNPRRLVEPMVFRHKDEKFDIKAEQERLIRDRDYKWPMLIYPMEFREGEAAEAAKLKAEEETKQNT